MKKLVILTFAMLVAGSLPAMQQQQHEQSSLRHQEASADREQQTKKTQKNKHHTQPEEVDAELADLKTEMAAIVKVVASQQNQGAVTSKTEQIEKKHERICPTCGRYSINCPCDQGRLAQGNIMTCGCRECGGAKGPLWVSQRMAAAAEYVAQKVRTVIKGGS